MYGDHRPRVSEESGAFIQIGFIKNLEHPQKHAEGMFVRLFGGL
jgi:hypothetical protein